MKQYSIGIITGILLTASAVMFLGAQNKNLGDIKVNSITIENREDINDKSTIILYNDGITIHDADGGGVALGNRTIALINDNDKFVVKMGINDGGGGIFQIQNANESDAVKISTATGGGGGIITIFNKKNNIVAGLTSTTNEDGVIVLYDRYGDFGWNKTGKK